MQNDFPPLGRVRFSLGEIIVDEGRRLRRRRQRTKATRMWRTVEGSASESWEVRERRRTISEIWARGSETGLVTKLRIKNTKKDEGGGGKRWWKGRRRKGGFETKGGAGTMACNLEPLEQAPWPCVAPFNSARLLHPENRGRIERERERKRGAPIFDHVTLEVETGLAERGAASRITRAQ